MATMIAKIGDGKQILIEQGDQIHAAGAPAKLSRTCWANASRC